MKEKHAQGNEKCIMKYQPKHKHKEPFEREMDLINIWITTKIAIIRPYLRAKWPLFIQSFIRL